MQKVNNYCFYEEKRKMDQIRDENRKAEADYEKVLKAGGIIQPRKSQNSSDIGEEETQDTSAKAEDDDNGSQPPDNTLDTIENFTESIGADWYAELKYFIDSPKF